MALPCRLCQCPHGSQDGAGLVLHEENMTSWPSGEWELRVSLQDSGATTQHQASAVSQLCLLLGAVFGKTTTKMPILSFRSLLLRRDNAVGRSEGMVGARVRSQSHHGEGQGEVWVQVVW